MIEKRMKIDQKLGLEILVKERPKTDKPYLNGTQHEQYQYLFSMAITEDYNQENQKRYETGYSEDSKREQPAYLTDRTQVEGNQK